MDDLRQDIAAEKERIGKTLQALEKTLRRKTVLTISLALMDDGST